MSHHHSKSQSLRNGAAVNIPELEGARAGSWDAWRTAADGRMTHRYCILGGRLLLQEDGGEIMTQAALPTGQTFNFSVFLVSSAIMSRVKSNRKGKWCNNLSTYYAPSHTNPIRV